MNTPLKEPVVLVTVSGPDKPGITSQLMEVLAESNATVVDIGQAVIHGWLSLSILFQMAMGQEPKAPLKDLLFRAAELGLKLEFQVFDLKSHEKSWSKRKKHQYAITLLADQIPAAAIHQVTAALVKYNLNIDEIQRLSDQEFSCIEILLSSTEETDQRALKKELLEITQALKVDVALQSEGIFRKAKRLVVMDMDSTLIQNEVIDELARVHGVYDEIAAITTEAMQGKMDFSESLRKRVALLSGMTREEVTNVYKTLKLTPGAKELIAVLKRLGYRVALISGGFACIAQKFKEALEIDYVYANELEFDKGVATGRVIPPIVDAQRKADLLDLIAQQERISLDQVIAIGDGANDIQMIQKAGLGIAFQAKPALRDQADLALNQKNLRSIFYLLGISERDLAGLI